MRRERGGHCLDRSVVEKISIGGQFTKVYHPGDGVCSEPWAWTFLTACLATLVGYDDARAVIRLAKYGEAA